MGFYGTLSNNREIAGGRRWNAYRFGRVERQIAKIK
jgi:hypothetical protein